MPLVPNKYTQSVVGRFPEPHQFTQATRTLSVECGYHVDPSTGNEVLVEKITQTIEWYSRVLSREEEHWKYETNGGPPVGFLRKVYGRTYLPFVNPGRRYMLLEQEEAEFHPWTGFQEGSVNLSSTRKISSYVIYDLNYDHLGLTPEEQAALEERGLRPDGPAHLVVDTARTWREANDEASIVEKSDANQVAKWVDPCEVQRQLVWEFVDRYDIYDITERRIRPGPPAIDGPRVQKKELYTYRLGVPIAPPEISAVDAGDGIRVDLEGGGAVSHGEEIRPTSYKLLRRKVTEAARDPSGDLYDRWETDPDPPSRRRILLIGDTWDLSGAPASPLPAAEPYTEPGDTSEPEDDGWSVIAELENTRSRSDPGFARYLDTDVVNGGVYEYAGVTLINREESPPSRPVEASFGGPTADSGITVRPRRTDDGTIEIDILRPVDVAFAGDDYGEVLEFDMPVDITLDEAEDLGLELGGRIFLRDAEPKLTAKAILNLPLSGLERGQRVRLPEVAMKVTGNQIQMDIITESDAWFVDSIRKSATRQGDRLVGIDQTELELRQP